MTLSKRVINNREKGGREGGRGELYVNITYNTQLRTLVLILHNFFNISVFRLKII